MNRRSVQSVCLLAATVAMLAGPRASHAQDQPPPAPAPHQHEAPADPHAGHVMAGSLFTRRDNAGTGWTPATTPMLAAHRQAGPWSLMLMGNGFVQYLEEFAPIHRGGATGGQHQLADGHGPASSRRWRGGRSRDAERRALHHRWLRLPEPPRQRRTVRRRRHPRQAAPARPGDGVGGRIQPPGHALPAVARLRRPCRRARPRPGGVPAPRLRHGQSDRADFAPLARRDAHHLRRRDQRPFRRPLACSRDRSSTAASPTRSGTTSTSARWTRSPRACSLRPPTDWRCRCRQGASRAPRRAKAACRRATSPASPPRCSTKGPWPGVRWQRRSPGAATPRCRRGRTRCWPKAC